MIESNGRRVEAVTYGSGIDGLADFDALCVENLEHHPRGVEQIQTTRAIDGDAVPPIGRGGLVQHSAPSTLSGPMAIDASAGAIQRVHTVVACTEIDRILTAEGVHERVARKREHQHAVVAGISDIEMSAVDGNRGRTQKVPCVGSRAADMWHHVESIGLRVVSLQRVAN